MSKGNRGNGQGQQGQAQASGGAGAPPATPVAGTPPIGETVPASGADPANGTSPAPPNGGAETGAGSEEMLLKALAAGYGTDSAAPGIAEGEAQQNAATPGITPQVDTGGNKPVAGTPPVPPAPPKEGKKRVKCEALKGGKIIIGKGEPVQIDENGFFEVDEKQAARLLSIPGYKEA